MRVLLVEDEPRVAGFIAKGLREQTYAVDVARDGPEALYSAGVNDYDLVILDVMLPGITGFGVVADLRRAGQFVPVLMLTARDRAEDVLQGFESGADDYLPKPFALEELLARLRALLRRTQGSLSESANAPLSFADLTLDPATREVTRAGQPVRLTRTEFNLLELLMRHPRQVLTRAQILEEVWGYDFPTTANSLEVYVGYLRRKTEADNETRLIHTVRGVGYSLRETAP